MGEGDRILTVQHYFDEPLKGIAEYQGRPHYYDRQFDHEKEEYSDVFVLTPLDDAVFRLAMEAWDIWLEWRAAFRRGEAKMDSHPSYWADDSKYKQVHCTLIEYLEQHRGSSFEIEDDGSGRWKVING